MSLTSGADVVIWVVQAARDLSRADYSVYEGWKVTGWPLTTIRRGQILYDNGQVIARAGTGKLIQRAAWRRALRSPR
jgi:dihydropyrimidinase